MLDAQTFTDARALLEQSEILFDETAITQAIRQMAERINQDFQHENPVLMCVMGGAVVFCGQLMPYLDFPLSFEYVHATRYQNKTRGQDIIWKNSPTELVKNRTVLLLDDILDEGWTLQAVRKACMEQGAKQVKIAVMVEKTLQKDKPLQADYVGLRVPDQYIFGFGMDIYGWWRNLNCIRVLKCS